MIRRLVLLVLIGAAGAGSAAGGEAPPAPAAPVLGLIADVRTTLTFSNGPALTTTARILRAGPLVRYEVHDADPAAPGQEEVQIYDFAAGRLTRLILAQHLSFESLIPPRFTARAKREGLAPDGPDPGVATQRLRLGETAVEGRPAAIVLLVRGPADRTGRLAPLRRGIRREYTLLWEARDPADPFHGLPLRVSYSQGDRSVVLVEYLNLRTAPLDPAVFRPPADFLQASPF